MKAIAVGYEGKNQRFSLDRVSIEFNGGQRGESGTVRRHHHGGHGPGAGHGCAARAKIGRKGNGVFQIVQPGRPSADINGKPTGIHPLPVAQFN